MSAAALPLAIEVLAAPAPLMVEVYVLSPVGPPGPAGGTFPDAPSDGATYGRSNAAWVRALKLAATPPAVTGSRGGNAALASLLTVLVGYGLIIDNTTP